MTGNVLEATHVSYQTGSRFLLRNVSVAFELGSFTVIAGPNGAGKSTLLNILTGELAPAAGEVYMHGKRVSTYRPSDLARVRGVMPQDVRIDVPMRVHQVVALGRFPHRKTSSAAGDAAIIKRALERTDTSSIVNRMYDTLSGGERARVALARLLVQETEVMVLDEPIAHLDPKHQYVVLEILRECAAAGKTVVVVLHDLHLARMYASHAVLLRGGVVVAAGSTNEVLNEEQLEQIFHTPFLRGELINGDEVILPTKPMV